MITQVYSEHSHNFSYFVNVKFQEIFTTNIPLLSRRYSKIKKNESYLERDFYHNFLGALGMTKFFEKKTAHLIGCENIFRNIMMSLHERKTMK